MLPHADQLIDVDADYAIATQEEFPLEQVAYAHLYMELNQPVGKIVVTT